MPNTKQKRKVRRMKTHKKSLLILISVSALILLVIVSYKVKAEPKDEPKEYIAEETAEEISETVIVPAISKEIIAEIMAGERPYVAEPVEEEPILRYPLTDEERYEVERVVMAEAGSESREGIMAVAQCILNASEKESVRPTEAIKMYKYTPNRKEPNEAVKEAVTAVFDEGETVTDEPILYFYANYIYSGWHESQRFVTQIGVHRFFAEKEIEAK